MMHMEAAIK